MSGPLDFPDAPSGDAAPGDAPPGTAPAPPPRPPRARPPGRTRYGWLVALLVLAVVVWISLGTLRSDGGGSTGLPAGTSLPPFATPLVDGDLDGDANVARTAEAGQAGRRPACEVRGPEILNSCQLAERGPVVLAFLATRGGDCSAELDHLQAAARGFPGVQLAAVAVSGDRGDLREMVRAHRWTFPVGYDRDGVLANLYGVAVCPQVTYAYPGGEVRGTAIGEESVATIRGRIARLVAASRERGWTPS
jgi:hypothetical protein